MKEVLCKAFCDDVLVRTLPAGLVAVSTGFVARSGDKIGFYVRKLQNGGYRIEDDGGTLPMLEASGLDLASGTRKKAMDALLAEYGVTIDNERREFFVGRVTEANLPAAAMKFVAFSLRVRDFSLMTEANVQST